MSAVLEWALANAVLATVLAVPAYASRWLRRPAITHALWILVLFRLVAPPTWHVPITWTIPSTTSATPPPVGFPTFELGSIAVDDDEPTVAADPVCGGPGNRSQHRFGDWARSAAWS